jgi:hypothetical protein
MGLELPNQRNNLTILKSAGLTGNIWRKSRTRRHDVAIPPLRPAGLARLMHYGRE